MAPDFFCLRVLRLVADMSVSDQLTVGVIHFLNCVPYFSCLEEYGFKGNFVHGVPSELNRLLYERQLDISPSSSFEYARHLRDYQLLPGHSISSIGAVKSVLLFSPVAISDLDGWQIALTGESATSINLLRVIFREFYGLQNVGDAVPEFPVEQLIAENRPALLIGDRALRQARNLPQGSRIYDLGELWYRFTGLPFVFALWMVRRAIVGAHADQVAQLGMQLMKSRTQVLHNPQQFAEKSALAVGLDVQDVIDYWQTIDYSLDEEHKRGLKLFFELCHKHGYLDEEPELDFLSETT